MWQAQEWSLKPRVMSNLWRWMYTGIKDLFTVVDHLGILMWLLSRLARNSDFDITESELWNAFLFVSESNVRTVVASSHTCIVRVREWGYFSSSTWLWRTRECKGLMVQVCVSLQNQALWRIRKCHTQCSVRSYWLRVGTNKTKHITEDNTKTTQ